MSKNLSLDLNLWPHPGQWSSVLRKLIRSSDDLVFKITLVKLKEKNINNDKHTCFISGTNFCQFKYVVNIII